MLQSTNKVECNSTIDKGAIINMLNSLSFNFSRVDFSSNKWYSLLSVPISSSKVAMYSRSNYSQVLQHEELRYEHPILEGRNLRGRRLSSISLQTPYIDQHYVC